MSDEIICLEELNPVMVAMTQVHSVETVLQIMAKGLTTRPGVALARIWLIGPGDMCAFCPMRDVCPNHSQCLHLAASAGSPEASEEDWSRTDGSFQRFPLGVRKVGLIGASGESLLIERLSEHPQWIVRPEWVERENIVSFGGHALIFRGEILGVAAIFTRVPLDQKNFLRLRLFADQAAVAIANARAFEEIERMRMHLEAENNYLQEEVKRELAFDEIVGCSPALKKTLRQVELVAATDATVLIEGESGTGKELIARAIHERSARRHRPLIKVNCAAIAPELFESEFFGHARGAFTGAVKDRFGRFQLADGGTLFLDEVGEIPLHLQGKLLRVLQEGEYERVGEDKTRRMNVRIIVATNRDLRHDVDAKRFRLDLYYRLSVFPITLSPLRERLEDIEPLAEHFAARAARKMRYPKPKITPVVLRQLMGHSWTGNVRELQNAIERAVIQAQYGGSALSFDFLYERLRTTETLPSRTVESEIAVTPLTKRELLLRERENISAALLQAKGKIYGPGGAAEMLGMKPTTLASRMKALGVKKFSAPALEA